MSGCKSWFWFVIWYCVINFNLTKKMTSSKNVLNHIMWCLPGKVLGRAFQICLSFCFMTYIDRDMGWNILIVWPQKLWLLPNMFKPYHVIALWKGFGLGFSNLVLFLFCDVYWRRYGHKRGHFMTFKFVIFAKYLRTYHVIPLWKGISSSFPNLPLFLFYDIYWWRYRHKRGIFMTCKLVNFAKCL